MIGRECRVGRFGGRLRDERAMVEREGGAFAPTRWSLVFTAADPARPEGAVALEHLCRTYWMPLYAHVRRRGHPPADAEDLTQQFFARILERDALATADPVRGRFRTFLLTSLERFLVSEWRRGQARDRGVIRPPEDAEAVLSEAGGSGGEAAELGFDRLWADALLERALSRLESEHRQGGRGGLYEALKPFVWGERAGTSFAEMGRELGLSEGAARVAVHRMRVRFRELLRSEVSATVSDDADVDDELRHLLEILLRT